MAEIIRSLKLENKNFPYKNEEFNFIKKQFAFILSFIIKNHIDHSLISYGIL